MRPLEGQAYVQAVDAKVVLRVGFEPTKLPHWILSPTPLTSRESQQLYILHNFAVSDCYVARNVQGPNSFEDIVRK